MPKETSRRSSMTVTNWIFLILIVGVLPIMLLSIIAFRMLVRDFIPTTALSWLSILLASGLYALVFGLIASEYWRGIPRSGAADGPKALLVLVLGPLLFPLITIFFVAGPLSYTMHRLEGPHASRQIVTIKEVLRGTRRCRFGERLMLQDSSFLFRRSVCAASGNQVGRVIELHGDESRYGFVYKRIVAR